MAAEDYFDEFGVDWEEEEEGNYLALSVVEAHAETRKAYLVSVSVGNEVKKCWLPKSQILLSGSIVNMPMWLYEAKFS